MAHDMLGIDAPRVDDLDPGLAARVRQTVSCRDCHDLPKVSNAGKVIDHHGTRVQVMHNGVLVEEGGYFGDWMAEIIRVLRGHHEPQEELVFSALVERVAETTAAEGTRATMVEVGSFWAYYSLWFCQQIPTARAYGIEPDPAYLEVGRRNVTLNGLGERIILEPGVVGAEPGETLQFVAESDGVERTVVQYDLASLMEQHGLATADLVLADIQGWETLFVQRALPLLRSGRVRFMLVSTHHHTISGNALTHQGVLDMLVGAGATVIAEHSVSESASGDGLIAVSFDDRDAGMSVGVSHVRARDSLFGELEHDLDRAQGEASAAKDQLQTVTRELAEARENLEKARARTRRLRGRVRKLRRERQRRETGIQPQPRSLPRRIASSARGRWGALRRP